jgi:hypothetical protein
MAASLRAPPKDPEQAKFQSKLLDKLKYCRDVLLSIKSASENQTEKAVTTQPTADRASLRAKAR